MPEHQAASTDPPKPTLASGNSRRRHVPGPGLLDLIWKIDYDQAGWSATLRSDPSVALTAHTGDDLAQLARDLTMAILEGHGAEALRAASAAVAA